MARTVLSKIVSDNEGQQFRVRRKLTDGLYFVAGRTVVDFSDLQNHASKEWLLQLIISFQEAFQYKPASSTIKGALQIKRFLIFVANSNGGTPPDQKLCAPLLNAMRDNHPIFGAKSVLQSAVQSFVNALNDTSDLRVTTSNSRRTRAAIIEQFQDACDELWRVQFFPPVEHMPRPSYSPLFHSNKLRSLIEISERSSPESSYSDVVSSSKRRVFEFRDYFQSILLEHYNEIVEWRKKISEDSIPIEQIIEAAKTSSQKFGKGGRTNPELEKIFPLNDEERLLLSALRLYQFVVQGKNELKMPPWAISIIRAAGGLDKLRNLTEGRLRSMMGAYMLVMIDSAANPQVIDDLPVDPKIARSKLGSADVYTISGSKARAGYREAPIVLKGGALHKDVVSLPVSIGSSRLSAYKAIQIWKDMSDPIRLGQTNADARLLWITRTSLGCRRYSAQTWAYEWALAMKDFAPDLVEGGGQFSRMDIRKTVKQIRAAEVDNNVDFAEATTQTTGRVLLQSYVHNKHTARLFAEKIREFQNILEAVIIGEKKFYKELRTQEQQNVLISKGNETGLGLTCGLHLNAPDPPVACHALDQCASCPSMRFVPTSESILDLAWLYVSLERQQEAFSSMNPERWMRVWLPLQALATVLRETLLAGPKARSYREAEAAALRSFADGSRPEFRPW